MNVTNRFRPVFGVAGLIAVMAGVAGAGCALKNPAGGATADAGSDARAQDVVCVGYLDVERGVIPLVPSQPGRVFKVLVKEGDAVEKDIPLIEMETDLARERVKEAEADLDAAREQLLQAEILKQQFPLQVAQQKAATRGAESNLAAARATHARLQRLADKELISAEEAQTAAEQVKALEALKEAEEAKLATLELNDPSIARGQAQNIVKAKEACLAQARYALRECTVCAPVKGTILRVQVNPGDVLGGQPQQSALLLCPDEVRIIRAEVAQEFAGRVVVGQTVTIRDDISVSGQWDGQVVRISDWYTNRRSVLLEPKEFNDVRTLECIIAVDGQPSLRIGQRMRVTIHCSARN